MSDAIREPSLLMSPFSMTAIASYGPNVISALLTMSTFRSCFTTCLISPVRILIRIYTFIIFLLDIFISKEHGPVHRSHENGAPNNISDCYRNQVFEEKVGPRQGFKMSHFITQCSNELWVEAFDKQSNRKEIHVGYAMFKPCCYEGSDRKNDGEDFIYCTASTICKPDRHTNQRIAEDTEDNCLPKSKFGFCNGSFQNGNSDRSGTKCILLTEKHQGSRRDGSNEVSNIHDKPVTQECTPCHFATCPSHYNEVVPCEKLRPTNHNEDKTQRKDKASQQARYSIWQAGTECGRAIRKRDNH